MAGDQIRRDQILERSVLNIGQDYADSLQPAIAANELWLASFGPIKDAALEYAEIEKRFKASDGRKEFLEIKKQEEQLSIAAAKAVKAEQETLIAKQKVQQSILDTERKVLQTEAAKDRAKKRTIKLTEQEKLELRILNRGKREAAVISSKLSTEYERQSVQLTQLRRKYKDLALTEGESSEAAKKLRTEIQTLDRRLKSVDASVGQFQRNVGNYTSALSAAGRAARQLASAMGLVGGAFLVVQVARDAIKVIRDFEKQNATLSAVLQVNREEMTALTEDAIRLGETTVKTAGDVTRLQIAYARLGFEQEDILNLTEATINGSIALNSQLDETANLTGALINTFDEFTTTDAPEVIDILALATARSALNFEKLNVGLPIVAGAANAAGIPFTRLVALLGKLADAGIDVSSSSTALRNIFIESAKQGLSYGEILDKIKDSQDKLTAANDEFGKRAAVSATVLSANIEATDELDQALQRAAGTAEGMAEKELNTLDGALKLLRSAWEGYILATDEATGTSIGLKDAVSFIANNLKTIIRTITTVVKVWILYKAAVLAARLQTALANKQLALTALQSKAAATGVTTTAAAWQRFNAILRANALFLAVAAIAGLVVAINRLNVSLSEAVEKTDEATEAFLEARTAQEEQAATLNDMADRYDELTSKTELNKDEQKELDDIINKIAKDVPGAVTEIDKYGNALKLNTEAVREFNAENNELLAQKQAALLKENEEQLKRLEQQQRVFNRIAEEGQAFFVDGVGFVAKYNGVLKETTRVQTSLGFRYKEGNELTSEQLDLVEKAIRQNEANIKNKKAFIETLTEEGRANIAAREEAEKKEEADRKASEEATVLANLRTDEINSVEALREKIKALRAEQQTLTLSDVQRGQEINKLIQIYQKQINTILGVSDANKSADKAAREALAKENKLRTDALKLQQFVLNSRIKEQQSIAKDTSRSFEEREKALAKASKNEIDLAFITARAKFKVSERFNEEEIENLIATGRLNAAQLEKITDEELLIIKQFQEKKKKIQQDNEDELDSLAVERLKSQAAIEAAEREKALNDDIRAENEAFQAREGVYANAINATELRERRIAEIKKKYAIEALKAQIAALEALLLSEGITAEKRAEIEAKIAKAKTQISELTTADFIANDEAEVQSTVDKVQRILDASRDLANALGDLAGAIFEARIARIDEEIEREDERFNRLLANDNLTEERRAQLERQQEATRERLEKKKKAEQRKQAITAKALAALNIGLTTSQAVIAALAPPPVGLGPILGKPLAILTAAVGALQLAAALAAPIPKFAEGHLEGTHEGWAITNDAIQNGRPVQEVWERDGKAKVIEGKNVPIYMKKGDRIHKSVDDYNNLIRASILTGVQSSNQQLNDFKTAQAFELNTTNLEDEMRLTRRAIQNMKPPIIYVKPPDLDHLIWRAKKMN